MSTIIKAMGSWVRMERATSRSSAAITARRLATPVSESTAAKRRLSSSARSRAMKTNPIEATSTTAKVLMKVRVCTALDCISSAPTQELIPTRPMRSANTSV